MRDFTRNAARRAVFGWLTASVIAHATPAHALSNPPTPHPNFVFFRYATLTSLSLYGAYGQGNYLAVFGMVQNPRTSYREIVGGIGMNAVITSSVSSVIAVAASSASDSWYAQAYLLPNASVGHVRFYGSIEYYEPLERVGVRQIAGNPLFLMWRPIPGFEVGGAYVGFFAHHSAATHQLGPAVQFSVPNGRLSLELLKRVGTSRMDLRATFQASF